LLECFVREGAPRAEVRRQEGPSLQSDKRSWRVTGGPPPSGEKLAGVDALTWSRSIACMRLEEAHAYCADVG